MKHRRLILLVLFVSFVIAGWWICTEQLASRRSSTSLVGHWAVAEGGIHFDASEEKFFQLDVMHTFYFGRWTPINAAQSSLQFFDMAADVNVMDNPDLVGSAVTSVAKGVRVMELTMPNGEKVTFHHDGPPSGDVLRLKF